MAGLPYIAHDKSEVLTDLFGAFGAVERVAVHPSQVGKAHMRDFMNLDYLQAQDAPTLASVLQTSAIVIFAEASSRKKAFRTAQRAKLVQLILAEPAEHYGLKGVVSAPSTTSLTWKESITHAQCIKTHTFTGEVLCRPCGGSQGALSRK